MPGARGVPLRCRPTDSSRRAPFRAVCKPAQGTLQVQNEFIASVLRSGVIRIIQERLMTLTKIAAALLASGLLAGAAFADDASKIGGSASGSGSAQGTLSGSGSAAGMDSRDGPATSGTTDKATGLDNAATRGSEQGLESKQEGMDQAESNQEDKRDKKKSRTTSGSGTSGGGSVSGSGSLSGSGSATGSATGDTRTH